MLKSITLTILNCARWNLFPSSIYLYSFHSQESIKLLAVFGARERTLVDICGLRSTEVIVDDDNIVTNDRYVIKFMFHTEDIHVEWIHIAEVSFRDIDIETPEEQSTPIIDSIAATRTTPSPQTYSKEMTSSNKQSNMPLTAPIKPTALITRKEIKAVNRSLIVRKFPPTFHTPLETLGRVTPLRNTSDRSSHVNTTRPSHTTPTLDTASQGKARVNSNIILASAVGCAVVVLLCMTCTAVSALLILRKFRKSQQSCLTEGSVSHLVTSKVAFNEDSKWGSEKVASGVACSTKPEAGMTTYMQNTAYVCHVARESAHIYQEIPSHSHSQTLNAGSDDSMLMVQNVAYRDPVAIGNRQVVCVDNVAYVSTSHL